MAEQKAKKVHGEKISSYDLALIATYLYAELKDEFETVHLSMNLSDSIKIYHIGDSYKVYIDADRYNVAEYRRSGTIVHTGKGSYAQAVDIKGGFSKKHISYVEKAIISAIERYVYSMGKERAGITIV